tara:strand:+ start:9768 stop:10616 length:849 start_codon:yes stop_codon:yes gene_type:complete
MKKVLITGSEGFVGKNLIKYLKNYSFQLIKTTDKSVDLKLSESWNRIEKCDYLIHLAGKSFVPKSWEEPANFIENNTLLITNALEYCRIHKAKLIFLSSYLYGNCKSLPIKENAQLEANNPYALTKLLSEKLCYFYRNNFQVNNVILRVFNLYGPGQPKNFLLSKIIDQVKYENFIEVESLSPKRDYIYIDDLCSAIVKAIDYKGNENTFNIGSGKSYSVKEMIDFIQNIYGTSLDILEKKLVRKNEILHTRADINLAEKELGWFPIFDVKDGLKKIKNFSY